MCELTRLAASHGLGGQGDRESVQSICVSVHCISVSLFLLLQGGWECTLCLCKSTLYLCKSTQHCISVSPIWHLQGRWVPADLRQYWGRFNSGLNYTGWVPLITDPPQTGSTTLTRDTWHMTYDIWHITCDTWHVTCDKCRGSNCLSKFQVPSSDTLGVKVFWRYLNRGWPTDLINHKGVCRKLPILTPNS